MSIYFNWRHIFVAWVVIVPIIFAVVIGLDAVTSLRGHDTAWDGVFNPRHDPIAISGPVADEADAH
jgi:hypothetical protein